MKENFFELNGQGLRIQNSQMFRFSQDRRHLSPALAMPF